MKEKKKRFTVDQLRKMGEIPYPEQETKSSRAKHLRRMVELHSKVQETVETEQWRNPQQVEPPKRDKKKRKDMGWAI